MLTSKTSQPRKVDRHLRKLYLGIYRETAVLINLRRLGLNRKMPNQDTIDRLSFKTEANALLIAQWSHKVANDRWCTPETKANQEENLAKAIRGRAELAVEQMRMDNTIALCNRDPEAEFRAAFEDFKNLCGDNDTLIESITGSPIQYAKLRSVSANDVLKHIYGLPIARAKSIERKRKYQETLHEKRILAIIEGNQRAAERPAGPPPAVGDKTKAMLHLISQGMSRADAAMAVYAQQA